MVFEAHWKNVQFCPKHLKDSKGVEYTVEAAQKGYEILHFYFPMCFDNKWIFLFTAVLTVQRMNAHLQLLHVDFLCIKPAKEINIERYGQSTTIKCVLVHHSSKHETLTSEGLDAQVRIPVCSNPMLQLNCQIFMMQAPHLPVLSLNPPT
jgi:hypothetical protein